MEISFWGPCPFFCLGEDCGEGFLEVGREDLGSRGGRGDVEGSRGRVSVPLSWDVDLLGSWGETI
jgi:hypothetical protein